MTTVTPTLERGTAPHSAHRAVPAAVGDAFLSPEGAP